MILAYDYPLFGLFWTMLFFSLWVAWIMTLFHVLVDIFRNPKTRGIQKAVWVVFVLFLPFIGVVTYVVVWGSDMAERSYGITSGRHKRQDDYYSNYYGYGGGARSSR